MRKSSAQSNHHHYKEGDIVLATDRGVKYEAKILKCQKTGANDYKYFIHFQGWGKKHDSWLDPRVIEPINSASSSSTSSNTSSTSAAAAVSSVVKSEETEETIAIKGEDNIGKESRRTSRGSSDKKAPSSSSSSTTTAVLQTSSSVVKKHLKELAMQDLADEDKDDTFCAKIPIPPSLKRCLVDEWTYVTNEPKKLLVLPRGSGKTARDLVMQYLAWKEDKGDRDQKLRDLMEGLLLYFDKALPMILLYRHERDQYDRICAALPGIECSRIYGAEHFLRLFVRITKLLSQCVLPSSDMNYIVSKFNDLLKFLQKNVDKFIELGQYHLAEEVMASPIQPIPVEDESGDKGAEQSAKKRQRTRR